MKVFLLQLPLQGHDFFFSHENIPLASACLHVIAAQQRIDAELLPNHLMSYGSDQIILQFLLDAKPDLVGMSCYQWNVERSLYLARQLKHTLPDCIIVLGGPEITPDNQFLLQHRDFDIGVVGEGEEVWRCLLESLPKIPDVPGLLIPKENRQWHFTGNNIHPPPLKHWPSPFLSGVLDAHVKGVLWLETVRGCVYHCAYCCYPKQSPGIRTIPMERILMEVRRAWTQGLKEIVFLDPCFTRRPHLEALLDGLASINQDHRLSFHAECNVEGIDSSIAEKMNRAGFTEIEVGLQSIKKSTLRRIHRNFHPERFRKGVRSLQNCGIEVMVDIIAGLPGDTLFDICRSLDWVLENEVYDSLMLYPLSLMPSTELRQRATELGLGAMPHPPYLLTRGPKLTAVEMRKAFQYYEECMEEDISPLEMPPALDPASKAFSLPGELRNVINMHTHEEVNTLSSRRPYHAYSLTWGFSHEILRQPDFWSPILRNYLKENPFTLLSIEVPPDVWLEEVHLLWQLAQEHRYPVDRDYTVTHTPYRSFLLFSRAKGLVWKWPDPREFIPLMLHDGQKISYDPLCLVATSEKTIPKWFLKHISERYPFPPEVKRWQKPDDEFN
jgi:hypothetical protein